MDDKYFTFNDFVADDRFRQWVKQPDEASSLFWRTYLTNNPSQAETMRLAAQAVLKLSEATAGLAEPATTVDEASIWHNVKAQILTSTDRTGSPFIDQQRGNGRWWLMAAASFVAVIGVGWWLQGGSLRPQQSVASRPATSTLAPTTVAKENTSKNPLLVSLPDGSSVLLQKGSHLDYPNQFKGGKRIVHLTGEAFFEVTKMPNLPFFVYANGLVTKVLGTSFTIKAYNTDPDVTVTVRSGRVAVFAQADEKRQAKVNSSTLDGTVLTRNQQLVFARQTVRLTTPKTVSPAIAEHIFSFNQANFQFEATPVSDVFAVLERVYGVRFAYDKATLGKCRLTADLTDESLADKLLIICKSIEATYTIKDTKITITGPGCGS